MIRLHLTEREWLMEPVTLDDLSEIFPAESVENRYDLDESIFVIDLGRLFYYFGAVDDGVFQLLATSSINLFDTGSTR